MEESDNNTGHDDVMTISEESRTSGTEESRTSGAEVENFAKKAALLRDHEAMVRVQAELDAEMGLVLRKLKGLKHVPVPGESEILDDPGVAYHQAVIERSSDRGRKIVLRCLDDQGRSCAVTICMKEIGS